MKGIRGGLRPAVGAGKQGEAGSGVAGETWGLAGPLGAPPTLRDLG